MSEAEQGWPPEQVSRPGWPYLPWAFPWVLAVCRESARRHSPQDARHYPPPYVSAVAATFGVDALHLWDHVGDEFLRPPTNGGFGQVVWRALWCPLHRSCQAPQRFRPEPWLLAAVGWPWLWPRDREPVR